MMDARFSFTDLVEVLFEGVDPWKVLIPILIGLAFLSALLIPLTLGG